ncbi:glycosyltransferase family 4 protein [Pedobacter sp. BMA]|uniref:glycosyltransferase family 4 protein n=1 Tax=Pedobacter sp. BMA TaxID=1663685 RepID=UPI00064B60A5|nr:glycosyltransferase [Pedobacter sp. BMA]KLT66630.1 hypothetical protein AB669_05510 [Pedobacter sp. BMA]
MNKKRFVTIVSHIENLELRKDTGQIPYHAYRTLGYDATLVSYYFTLSGGRSKGPVKHPPKDENVINNDYPYLKSEVNGLKLHFMPDLGRGKFYEKSIVNYLLSESKKIDILNLFHFSAENIFYTLLYKLKNPKGKVYIKLDIDVDFYKSQTSFFNTNSFLGSIKKFLYSVFLMPVFYKTIDLLSAESEYSLKYFQSRFPKLANKTVQIPNGVDHLKIRFLIKKLEYNEKENIILFVGRVGSQQKNTELILRIAPQMNLKYWKIILAGPVEENFKKEIIFFFEKNPYLKEKIIFIGNLTEPTELYKLYNRSKILLMPSQHEGFPNAGVEAIFFGLVPVLSDKIYAFNTLTDFGQHGFNIPIDNDSKTISVINKIIDNESILEKLSRKSSSYAEREFIWQNIITKLDSYLTKATEAPYS